jgi:hypothetical protein
MNLSDIRKIVSARWRFNSDEYPHIRTMSPEAHRDFSRSHILKHAMKSLGKMAAISEDADHVEPRLQTPHAEMAVLIAKMLVNLMQLADSYGITNEELERVIRDEDV